MLVLDGWVCEDHPDQTVGAWWLRSCGRPLYKSTVR